MDNVSIHVIPVPRHMTPTDAAFELETCGQFVGYAWWKPRFWRPRWACVRITRGPFSIEVL